MEALPGPGVLKLSVEVVSGSAAEFHARPLPPGGGSHLWWFEVTRPALVIGTSQPESVVDLGACAAAGVDVVRRHSGGGAVLLVPGDVAWFDLVIPRGHPRWLDDIARAAWWVGEGVAAALAAPDAVVHTGAMVRTVWSSSVCFAGLGPGEVTVGGRKLVGISQRRTRDIARFQVAVYRRWDPGAIVHLLAPPRPTAAELADLVATATLDLDALIDALS